ncbi:hypothetical protein [Synechococcus sp. UW140]|uniref:beta strand repeat-containing protein n=1 Tax=Synechococcus sp. UW140 TaxID=368503 RepID=UPI003137D97A
MASETSNLTPPPLEASPSQLSQSFDNVKAAGLQDIALTVDAGATIGANSTAKSSAASDNVTGSSTSVSKVEYNSGLQSAKSELSSAGDGFVGGTSLTQNHATGFSAGTYTIPGALNTDLSLGDKIVVGGQDFFVSETSGSTFKLADSYANALGGIHRDDNVWVTNGDNSFGTDTFVNATGQNTANVKSDAGLSGIASTTANSAANTSAGDSNAFASIGNSAGIQDLNILSVGGELNALGKAVNSINADANTVVGKANAAANLSGFQQGFEAAQIGVSSNATIQGLSQLTNAASASATSGTDSKADAEATVQTLQGSVLDGLSIGGTGSIAGQAGLSNLSTADNVSGSSEALSKLHLAAGLSTTTTSSGTIDGTDIKSDAGLTGISSITNNATAKTSAGDADADAIGTTIKGAQLGDLTVGGVGTIGGQATYGAKATAENVNGGHSDALASLTTVQGLDNLNANTKLDVKSDATIQGLANITNDALASGTNAVGSAPTGSQAIAEAVTLQGADLGSNTDIGGIGSITGQVNLASKATGENVTGNSLASASLGKQTAAGAFDGGLAQGLFTGVDSSNAAYGTDIKSDATIKGLSGINLQAAATTTAGVADADAFAGRIDGANLGDVQIGGIGSLAGQSTFTGKANSSNVTGGGSTADAKLVDADGMAATAGLNIKSDGGITGLNTANLSAIAESTGATGAPTSATARATADTLQGAELGQVTVGGIGNIVGQTNLTSLADGSNVTGAATGTGTLGTAEGLDLSGIASISSDATVKGIASVNSVANAETTAGAATASATGSTINGADLSTGSAGLDIGGLGTIQGQANFAFTADASNVGGAAAEATAGSLYASSSDPTLTAKGLIGESTASGVYGIDVASDATLSGMAIGSLKANASSTAQNATARSGDGDSATGADLPSLNVGGLANLTGAAQLDSASIAESVGGVSTALAGQGQTVTGLTSAGEGADSAWITSPATSRFSPAASGTAALSTHTFDTDLNINVASDAMLTAQGFSNLDATATSTAGNAIADAGNSSSTVTGVAADMDIKVGGISNLTALAQGTADASAESVTGLADAFAAQAAMGINKMEIQSSSDGILKSTASVVGGADAVTTGNGSEDTAWAAMDFDATGINGLAMKAGGIGDLNAMGSVTGSADATSVAAPADARADIDAMGLQDAWFSSASDGTISGIGKVVADLGAISTASTAKAEGDFDATGIQTLEAGIGGISILKGQAQVTAGVSAESVSGSADAFSGVNLASPTNAFDFTANASAITGLDNIELAGKSDGNILGTASGAFTTSAESVTGNATANAAQTLRGINTLNLDLGGQGTINAIVNDTNFVEAHSVSGNATAVASVDAIGLNGGNIHIAGNASIMANVGVDSEAKAETIG